MTQAWPASDLTALVVEAVAEIRRSAAVDPETVQGWCFEATKDLYRRMVEIGDFTSALRAVKQLHQLARSQ
jgi:ribulose kinase